MAICLSFNLQCIGFKFYASPLSITQINLWVLVWDDSCIPNRSMSFQNGHWCPAWNTPKYRGFLCKYRMKYWVKYFPNSRNAILNDNNTRKLSVCLQVLTKLVCMCVYFSPAYTVTKIHYIGPEQRCLIYDYTCLCHLCLFFCQLASLKDIFRYIWREIVRGARARLELFQAFQVFPLL